MQSSTVENVAAPRPRKSIAGRLVLVAILLAFVVVLGLRIKSAMSKQSQLAEERTQTAAQAAQAASEKARGPVQTVHGAARRFRPEVPVEGTLMPAREADLGFKLPGRLQSIRVKVGDVVQKGEVLATLDSTEAMAQLQAAQAQVKAAEAQLGLADDGARRTTALVDTGAQAQAAGVQATSQRALAAAQLDAARAQLALAQAAAGNHTLVAPFAGHVTKVPSGPGAIVNPGVPLFHLQDLSTLRLVGTVSGADGTLARVGAPVKVQADGRAVEAKLTAVLASVDPVTRRLPVEAAVPNDRDQPLLAGTFVRAVIETQREIEVLALPGSTLRPGSQDEVMAVEAGHLVARPVAFTRTEKGELLVRAGLAASDAVLLAPTAEARTGDAVTP